MIQQLGASDDLMTQNVSQKIFLQSSIESPAISSRFVRSPASRHWMNARSVPPTVKRYVSSALNRTFVACMLWAARLAKAARGSRHGYLTTRTPVGKREREIECERKIEKIKMDVQYWSVLPRFAQEKKAPPTATDKPNQPTNKTNKHKHKQTNQRTNNVFLPQTHRQTRPPPPSAQSCSTGAQPSAAPQAGHRSAQATSPARATRLASSKCASLRSSSQRASVSNPPLLCHKTAAPGSPSMPGCAPRRR